ncbi:NUDIX hydrolase N-terminal domain-containing protein [Paenibacillus sp. OSY-SE]|uniref:NUDIX hydrolase N-terminal domain-containing protein n=1 Tax=Paenibacillus sp. OSY-SE TaxID=1196323 RepID=UPI00030EBADF
MIRAVLFDFDGTLADTLPLSLHAFTSVFKRYDNRIVTNKEIVAMFGPTEEGILTANLRHAGLLPQAIEEYFELYRNWHPSFVRSSADIRSLLQALKERGIAVGVVTGKGRRAYDISVGMLGLAPFIDVAITGDDVKRSKPDPEGIAAALHALQAVPAEAVWIGDSEADIAAGIAAGVYTAGAKWFDTVQSDHFATAPNAIFTRTKELLDLIDCHDTGSTNDLKWLQWAKRLQALAQTGLTYTKDVYDRERYEELREMSVDMMANYSKVNKEQIELAFAAEDGYATPKVDVRGVVFKDNRILLVREKADGAWSLPGGWADIGYSPAEIAVKEINEESGYEAEAVRLLAVMDKRLHHHPPEPYHVYKLFIQCRVVGGEALSGVETSAVRFFREDELPELSVERNTERQIRTMFEFLKQPDKPVILD